MAEEYTKIFVLSKEMYIGDSPVSISEGALYRDEQTKNVFVRLQFKNIQSKAVKSVKVAITPFDNVEQQLSGSIIFDYPELLSPATANFKFGFDKQIDLPNKLTTSFSVTVLEVLFFDGTNWMADNYVDEKSQRAQYVYNQKLAEYKNSTLIVDEVCEAKLFAQAVELQLLKAPATAKFCDLEEMTVTLAGDRYIVSGYVDSQNSYGALIRDNFQLTVLKHNGVWKNTDKLIDYTVINKQIENIVFTDTITNTMLYWVLGIAGTIITFAIFGLMI